jgi:hypothetical protein
MNHVVNGSDSYGSGRRRGDHRVSGLVYQIRFEPANARDRKGVVDNLANGQGVGYVGEIKAANDIRPELFKKKIEMDRGDDFYLYLGDLLELGCQLAKIPGNAAVLLNGKNMVIVSDFHEFFLGNEKGRPNNIHTMGYRI